MSMWSEVSLSEVTDNFDSIRVPVKESERRRGPFPYYGASGVVDYVDGYLFDGEYLLIAEDGENLKTQQTPIAFMARGRFWVNNHAHIVRGNQRAVTRFIMYALRSVNVSGYLTGSTMPKLTQANLNRIRIPYCPLPEQHAIAHILSSLDDKIELNRRMNETLEGMARTIFKSWFVDFDPVRAKKRGQKPVGMDAATAALFPNDFEDSKLGKIPNGWKVGTLEDIALLNRVGINPGDYPAEAFDHYSIPSFDEGRVPKRETGSEIKSNKFVVLPNSVLLSKLNPRIKRVWNPQLRTDVRSVCSTEFFVMTPLGLLTRTYLHSLFTSDAFIDTFATLVTGTSGSHQRVQPDQMLASQVLVPPPQVVNVFSGIVGPLTERINANVDESRTIATLRDTLLPKLMSGEIRVKDAEKIVEGES